MPVRFLSLILAATFFVAAANAQSICDGKYDAAQEMLDAAYGKYETLYSGGDHWHRQDNVGATMDLYRLWRGLPDHQYRRAGSLIYGFSPSPAEPFLRDPDMSARRFALQIIETAMTDSRSRKPLDTAAARAAVLADRYTSKGPVGWVVVERRA